MQAIRIESIPGRCTEHSRGCWPLRHPEKDHETSASSLASNSQGCREFRSNTTVRDSDVKVKMGREGRETRCWLLGLGPESAWRNCQETAECRCQR